MLLNACGYQISDKKISDINEFLDKKKVNKIDLKTLIWVLRYLKELELIDEQDNDSDEYLDTFVALGGSYNKEGFISKSTLLEIIK